MLLNLNILKGITRGNKFMQNCKKYSGKYNCYPKIFLIVCTLLFFLNYPYLLLFYIKKLPEYIFILLTGSRQRLYVTEL